MADIIHSQMCPKDQKYLKAGKKNEEKTKKGTQNSSFLWVAALLEMYLLYSVPS